MLCWVASARPSAIQCADLSSALAARWSPFHFCTLCFPAAVSTDYHTYPWLRVNFITPKSFVVFHIKIVDKILARLPENLNTPRTSTRAHLTQSSVHLISVVCHAVHHLCPCLLETQSAQHDTLSLFMFETRSGRLTFVLLI